MTSLWQSVTTRFSAIALMTAFGTVFSSGLLRADHGPPCAALPYASTGYGFAPFETFTTIWADGENDDLGVSMVWMDDGTLAVGAPGDDTAAYNRGAVHLYRRSVDGHRVLPMGLIPCPFTGSTIAAFGNEVAGTTNWLAVAVRRYTNGAPAVMLYQRQGDDWNLWEVLYKDDPPGTNDGFGYKMAMDGDSLAVLDGYSPASVTVFQRQPDDHWARTAMMNLSGTFTVDSSVALRGHLLAIGQGRNGVTSFKGAVTLWQRSGTNWLFETNLVAADSGAGDRFGAAVAIAPNRVFVGAYAHSGATGNSGTVHVFQRTNGIWSQETELSPDVLKSNELFGRALAFNDEGVPRLAVSSRAKTRLFELVNGVWEFAATIRSGLVIKFAGDPAPAYVSGFTNAIPEGIALRGRHLIVGYPGMNGLGQIQHSYFGWHTVRTLFNTNYPPPCHVKPVFLDPIFVEEETANPTDSDGDGVSDLAETFHGTRSDISNAAPATYLPFINGGQFTTAWTRSTTNNPIVGMPEWSSDLSAWSSNGITTVVTGTNAITFQETVQVQLPASGSAGFFRLRLSLPPPQYPPPE